MCWKEQQNTQRSEKYHLYSDNKYDTDRNKKTTGTKDLFFGAKSTHFNNSLCKISPLAFTYFLVRSQLRKEYPTVTTVLIIVIFGLQI